MLTTDALSAALSGRYAIERLVGEGGMAKVYLARDLRHSRRVALKVLRPDLGAVLGVDRFQAEIQVTANLQHPNLLPLFDSGAIPSHAGESAESSSFSGLLYYVMPYVDGESLRARLDREKQLPVDEALRIATAIAGALDYAHRKGVVHRDLKPENILIHEGQPLVADFGIALAISNAGGARITQTGLSLGTPQYMSPEQATGDRVIDGRTDIYSLGALTYEMLTGDPPHTGSTAQVIIARVLTEKPRSILATRPSVPEHVGAAVDRALEKLPADRFETAKGFSDALANPSSFARASMPLTMARGVTRARLRDPAFVTVGAVALGAIAVAAALAARAPRSSEDAAHVVEKFALEVPDSLRIYEGNGQRVAISRDGSQIVYVAINPNSGNRMLFLRRLDDLAPQAIRSTEFATAPSFSPDGNFIAFVRRVAGQDRSVDVVRTSGGIAREISRRGVGNVSWGDGGRIVGADRNELFVFSVDGGAPRLLLKADSARGIFSMGRPELLPGGDWVLLTYWRDASRTIDDARMGVVSIKDGSFADLGVAGGDGHYAEPGYVLFGRNESEVYAIPFSLSRRKVTGPPVLLTRDVRIGARNAVVSLSVSRNGTMVFQPGSDLLEFRDGRPLTMVAVDRKGVERPLLRDTSNYESPRVSPDGRRIAVTIGGAAASGVGSTGTWIVDIASGTKARISTDSNSFRGEWSRDGSTVFYRQQLTGSSIVWARPWDASGPAKVVARGAADDFFEFSFGPAHGWAAVRHRTAGPRANLKTEVALARVDSLEASRPFLTNAASIVNARVSPDGKVVAYASNETGRAQVYMTPIPGPGPRVLVSVDGGEEPAWSWDGKTVFYRTPLPSGRMMAATIAERPALAVARRDTLFVDTYARQVSHSAYDVFPDGRLLMTKDASSRAEGPKAYVILHWQQLLARLAAGASR